MATRWDQTLDEYETALVRCEEHLMLALDGTLPFEETLLGVWNPPRDLGPLPLALESRARDLQAYASRLESQVEFCRDALDDRLTDLRHRLRRQGHNSDSNDLAVGILDRLA